MVLTRRLYVRRTACFLFVALLLIPPLLHPIRTPALIARLLHIFCAPELSRRSPLPDLRVTTSHLSLIHPIENRVRKKEIKKIDEKEHCADGGLLYTSNAISPVPHTYSIFPHTVILLKRPASSWTRVALCLFLTLRDPCLYFFITSSKARKRW